MEKTEISVPAPSLEAARLVFGVNDQTRKMIERELPVALKLRDEAIVVSGDPAPAERAASLLADLLGVAQESLRGGRAFNMADVQYLVRQSKDQSAPQNTAMAAGGAKKMLSDVLVTTERGKPIGPRTAGQKEYVDALREHEMVFSIGPAGTGKCIAADSLVLTEQGMLQIGEIGAGLDEDEEAPLDLKVWGRQGLDAAAGVYCGGQSATLKFETRFGFEIETTPEHPLLRLDFDGQLRWTRADALREDDIVALSRGAQLFGTQTRVDFAPILPAKDHCSAPVKLEELDEEFAYFLGVMVGDGCLTARNRVILSSGDAAIVALFERIAARFGLKVFPNTDRPHDYVIASSQLRALLLHLGLSGGKAATKRVPAAILRAPQSLVAAFLSGLFDADGSIDKRDGAVTFSTVSTVLARQVQTVLLNFGIVAARGVKNGRYKGARHQSELLTIAGVEAERFHQLIGFGLERKRVLQQIRPRNVNVDLVPHCADSLSAAVRSTVMSRADHKLFHDYRIARRAPSYAKLGALVEVLESRGAATHLIEPIQTRLDDHFLFLPIRSIEPSRAEVFDLTVPGSHSFVANGFVNHNTYLAVAAAVAALKNKQVARVILTRPAVEAGERLGFLPGDLEAKIDPYLRPLYDALYDLLDMEKAQKLFERKVIEIAPLAYMRGRTLNDAFVILDEAQNATGPQMKMFLTRLGFGSRMVITGDVTQTDLPRGEESGLKAAARVLPGVPGIGFVFLGQADVVRHNLVQRIIEAYDQNDHPERG